MVVDLFLIFYIHLFICLFIYLFTVVVVKDPAVLICSNGVYLPSFRFF